MFILFFGWYKTKQNDPSVQKEISLEEHLKKTDEEWFLTGKKEYQVKAMMVSKETSFRYDCLPGAVDFYKNLIRDNH